MQVFRDNLDFFYDVIKPLIFKATEKDPQVAHELFTYFCKGVKVFHLEKIILDNIDNLAKPPFELSNAAGFNKNADIPPTVLKYLGFDRVVFGTITYDQWKGNSRPTIKRYAETESMVNWMGLPGDGAEVVAERIEKYDNHKVPITINFMSTPQKQGDELLKDLEGTILATRKLPHVDRYELNISCPNTHGKDGKADVRRENLRMLNTMLELVDIKAHNNQDIYVKVSPDSSVADVEDTINIGKDRRVNGVVTCNTTTIHDRRYVPISPQVDGKQVGGASGDAVYEQSIAVQKMYENKIKELKLNWKIIACGGNKSTQRVNERLEHSAVGIQIYTPLIFSGTKLLRELRRL